MATPRKYFETVTTVFHALYNYIGSYDEQGYNRSSVPLVCCKRRLNGAVIGLRPCKKGHRV